MAAKMGLQNKNDLLNYYLTMNMNNICRICLEKSGKLTPIFDPVKPPHFSVLIMACAAVQVQEGDGLPPYVCQKCISRINIAFQFKTQCEASDTKLRQCFENYSVQEASDFGGQNGDQKVEQHNKQTQIDEQPYIGDLSEEQTVYTQCQEAEDKYKDELALEQSEVKNQMEPYGSTDNSTIKLEDLNIQTNCNNTKVYAKDRDNSMVKLEDLNAKNKRSKRAPKVHQCNTCGKIFRTKPSLVHHIRIHTGERPYVCHLCQKRFVNGGHLHTHMKTHTGEKNHVCAACNKGFATAQQLTKHTIAIHTSERPYGCTYCPKRFASSSNLNTHIKIHTGEKNFHCEICGKTFSTKGQLQQHLLVHTGEKAFLCEYCNKRFSQKAHLIRHLRIHNRTD